MNVGAIVQHARVFEMLMSEEVPEVYQKLHDLKITSDHYLLDWWMTMYCRKLPLRLVARLWDLYLLGGELWLHKAALVLVKMHSAAILGAPDFDDAFRALNAPLDADEKEFMTMVAQIQVQDVWSAVLIKLENEKVK